jgi:hypothetical protein
MFVGICVEHSGHSAGDDLLLESLHRISNSSETISAIVIGASDWLVISAR